MDEIELFLKGRHLKKLYEMEYQEILEKYELKPVEVDLLYLLSMAGERNTSRDLKNVSGVSKAHISKAIDHLRKRQLIRIEEDARDRRCSHLYMTEAGNECLVEIRRIQEYIRGILYQGITDSERQVLTQVAKKVTDNIKEEIKRKS
ncbi:MAG: winged helix DNA-binding protein [Lachnospiraceae bacterium]|nr:winged helix DNA-binding protein [Lachnospiraceae bacterium]